jgi:glycosyltransferase involved in cell wall biosynthesis
MVGGSDVLVHARQGARRRRVGGVLKTADAVVAVSQDLRAKILEFGVHPEKVHVVPRGVDLGRFAPGDRAEARRRLGIPEEGDVILWVGRMVPVKGLDVLIRACGILRDRGAPARVYLVGDGPSRPALESQSRAGGLSEIVSFVGSQPHDRLPDWYRAADLTVLPSRSEGIPNVLRESLACGTPFVASRVGGIPELAASDPDSRLVPPDDADALGEAIGRALTARGTDSTPRPRPVSLEESARVLTRILRSLVPTSPCAPRELALGRCDRPD